MGYVESNLLNGEHVIYTARLHPVIYVPSIVSGGAGILLIILAIFTDEHALLILLGLAGLVLGTYLSISAFIEVKTSEFAVTNRRVLIKVGWLRRTSLELLLPKVEGIGVDQDLLGRMLDFGSIGIRGIGGSRESFANIAAPLEFRRQVQALLPE